MDFLKWAEDKRLPSFLQSRDGWAQMLESYRTEEPHLHQIEPTNSCPYSCVMCPRSEFMTRKTGLMDFDLFKRVIDEVATYQSEVRAKEIELFHFGESLLHPLIAEMVGYIFERDLKATLSINPADLNPQLTEKILSCQPYKIIVSIDSMNSEKYNRIKGVAVEMETAILNTEALLEMHGEMKSKTEIIIRMIVMDINRDEQEQFKAVWEEKGAVVELRDFFPWNKKELQSLGEVSKYPARMPCPFCWQYVVVQWNGDVVACCRDYNAVLKMGNVREKSLKEIWNGREYSDFRQKMAAGEDMHPLCEECLEMYYTDPDNS